ncbi:MAG: TIGR02453 family protein, partial [Gammaproteobacteria bacterium]|nr:TIGR02453 family protein [Gammaproteobacteria bacterium]
GFYVHVEPHDVFLAAGIWHPEPRVLAQIRETIADNPNAWRKARDDKKFGACFELRGDTLKRPPRGFDDEHAMIEDLKRKDFIAVEELRVKEIFAARFADRINQSFTLTKPLMRFLCHALNLKF